MSGWRFFIPKIVPVLAIVTFAGCATANQSTSVSELADQVTFEPEGQDSIVVHAPFDFQGDNWPVAEAAANSAYWVAVSRCCGGDYIEERPNMCSANTSMEQSRTPVCIRTTIRCAENAS